MTYVHVKHHLKHYHEQAKVHVTFEASIESLPITGLQLRVGS